MRNSILFILSLLVFITTPLSATPSKRKIQALYSSLDRQSITQHLAFYELYPETTEGQRSLEQACTLLAGDKTIFPNGLNNLNIPHSAIEGIVNLVNKQPNHATPLLTQNQLAVIDTLAWRLENRQLKGYGATREQDVIALPPDEIDLARGIFLSQIGETEQALQTIRSYEAMIDLMALQILSRLPSHADPTQKIQAINTFIFHEMGFRFPPHSLYAKDVDLYTFLPSVLDSRHGVCLGVSILYLSLAQRLNLPLEAITPPGHIYIRYRKGNREINIETTARGIHLDSEDYLGIDTRSLQQRTIKEVIGLAHINGAAAYWKEEEYAKALNAYKKARPYLPDDMLLKELMGYNYLFVGDLEKGKSLLNEVKYYIPPHAISKSTIAEDYIAGKIDVEGLKAIFMHVDETRESILKKKDALEQVLEAHPQFREGWQNLAITWLQLHRTKEALHVLNRYHELESGDPDAEYYLSAIYAERLDYKRAWKHLRNAERIVYAKQHHPKALKSLRRQLSSLFPE